MIAVSGNHKIIRMGPLLISRRTLEGGGEGDLVVSVNLMMCDNQGDRARTDFSLAWLEAA